ncbi:MAG: hypothetical protein LBC42_02610, partial [Puniceicoccales bacterium]|nr:hypothetical protein [Puniceicoccales bacterium]
MADILNLIVDICRSQSNPNAFPNSLIYACDHALTIARKSTGKDASQIVLAIQECLKSIAPQIRSASLQDGYARDIWMAYLRLCERVENFTIEPTDWENERQMLDQNFRRICIKLERRYCYNELHKLRTHNPIAHGAYLAFIIKLEGTL